jgi:putative acetyltransferase
MEILIRPVEPRDACGINELRRMPGVFENILGIPSERLKKAEDWLAALDENTHSFVAVIGSGTANEKIVGDIGLTVYNSARTRHSAVIGMMVHKDYQGQGIGTKLLKAALDIADNWLMLVRVELDVYTGNEAGIALYQKFGFEFEGVKRKAAIRNGEYVDVYIMARVK